MPASPSSPDILHCTPSWRCSTRRGAYISLLSAAPLTLSLLRSLGFQLPAMQYSRDCSALTPKHPRASSLPLPQQHIHTCSSPINLLLLRSDSVALLLLPKVKPQSSSDSPSLLASWSQRSPSSPPLSFSTFTLSVLSLLLWPLPSLLASDPMPP